MRQEKPLSEADLRVYMRKDAYWNKHHPDHKQIYDFVTWGFEQLYPSPEQKRQHNTQTRTHKIVSREKLRMLAGLDHKQEGIIEYAGGPEPVYVNSYHRTREGQRENVTDHYRGLNNETITLSDADIKEIEVSNQISSSATNGSAMRIEDHYGKGHFGAPRGNRTHDGIDLIAQPGETILSPIEGIIESHGWAYTEEQRKYDNEPTYKIVNIRAKNGFLFRLFYVSPNNQLKAGDKVKIGDPVGTLQDLRIRYPDTQDKKAITPHVHVAIWNRDKKYIDPTPFFFPNSK